MAAEIIARLGSGLSQLLRSVPAVLHGRLRQLSALVTAFTLLSYATSLLRERATAAAYGATLELDTFIVASTVITIAATTPTKALYDPLVTLLAAENERSRASAAALVRAAFAIGAVVLMLVALVVLGLRPVLAQIVAPGMAPAGLVEAARLTLLLAPAIVFLGLGEIARAVLHAYGEFMASSVLPILGTIMILGSILLLSASLGIDALVLGTLAAGVVQVLAGSVVLAKLGAFSTSQVLPDRLFASSLVRPILTGVFLMALSNVSQAIDRVLGSLLPEGRIATLNYASRMLDFGAVATVGGIATVIYPYMSKMHATGQMVALERMFRRSLAATVAITVPAAAALSILSAPLVASVLGSGRFDAHAQRMTAESLAVFALALPFIAAGFIVGRSLYASRQIGLLIAVNLVFLLVKAGVGYALVRDLEHVGVAAATVVAHASAVAAALLALRLQGTRLAR